jgi:hypothetical protein
MGFGLHVVVRNPGSKSGTKIFFLGRPNQIWVIWAIILSNRIGKSTVRKIVKEREEKTAHMTHFHARVP